MAVYKLQIVDEEGNVVQQDDITPIEQVNVEVSQTTGEASGSASYGDGRLDIHLQGIKGETGERGKDGQKGEQGEKGDTVILGDGQEYTLYNAKGGNTNGAMTQNAVTNETTYTENISLDEIEETSKTINSSNVWTTSQSGNKSMLIPVQPSSVIQCLPVSTLTYAFMTSNSTSGTPAYAEGYSTVIIISESAGLQDIQVPANATYMYILSTFHDESRKPQVIRYKMDGVKDKIDDVKSWVDGLILHDVTDIPLDSYVPGVDGTFIGNANSKHAVIPVSEGERYVVGFNANAVNSATVVIFATSAACSLNAPVPYVPGTGRMTVRHLDGEKLFEIPSGCKYLLLYNGGGGTEYIVKKPVSDDGAAGVAKTIEPALRYEMIDKATGEVSGTYYGIKNMSTPRFIKTNSLFAITSSATLSVRALYYNESCEYIGHAPADSWMTIQANTPTAISVPVGTQYVKLCFIGVNYEEGITSIPTITLTGAFPEDWDTFSARPLDSGYQRMAVRVFVTDPNCCDDESQNVQDNGEWLVDYGIIALPQTYSNTGKPTRLIIYCHGAAVNYSTSATRFNAQDLEPDYWLAEGYAVMDIEGNPFDNVNEHICIPQAMDSYVAAYKWAVEHYNLKRDGVFLGGRSMGGYNTFNLIRRECKIPVIAACPNVPSSESFGYGQADRKAFCALHMGFDVPDGYEFKDTANMTDADFVAQRQLLYNNWDKWVKCVPVYNMCYDLPAKDVFMEMWNEGTRTEVLSKLHAHAKCPVKLFGCHEDPSCPPEDTSALYYRMLINSGQIAELRLFHTSIAVSKAHHYDTQDPALRTSIVTRYGEQLSNIPVVYIEMLRFWRRYEQEEL